MLWVNACGRCHAFTAFFLVKHGGFEAHEIGPHPNGPKLGWVSPPSQYHLAPKAWQAELQALGWSGSNLQIEKESCID